MLAVQEIIDLSYFGICLCYNHPGLQSGWLLW